LNANLRVGISTGASRESANGEILSEGGRGERGREGEREGEQRVVVEKVVLGCTAFALWYYVFTLVYY
jgi:hypothetical protein